MGNISNELRARIFAAYLGHQVKVDLTPYISGVGITCNLKECVGKFNWINPLWEDSRCNQFVGVKFEQEYGIEYYDVFDKKVRTYGDAYKPEHCQLILTPLSSITDEHAIEVAKIAVNSISKIRYTVDPIVNDYGFGDTMHKDVKCVGVDVFNSFPTINDYVKMYLIQIDTEEFDITKGYYNGETYVDEPADKVGQILDYLRSVGYDCGYGSIPSLINAGIAIEKK